MINYKYIKHVAVTGVTGDLGKQLLNFFERHHVQCTVLVRNKNYFRKNIKVIVGDLSNCDALRNLVSDADFCIHLAAFVGYSTKDEYMHTNVIGTENLCNAILEVNPKCRLIHCSSFAALNYLNTFFLLRTKYAQSKYLADQLIQRLSTEKALRYAIVFPGLIYGPGDSKFIPSLLKALRKKYLFYVSGGEQNAPLSYTEDLCKLFYKIIQDDDFVSGKYPAFSIIPGGMWNVISSLAKIIGMSPPKIVIPKAVLILPVLILECYYKIKQSTKTPLIGKRTLDVLSITTSGQSWDNHNYFLSINPISLYEGLRETIQSINITENKPI